MKKCKYCKTEIQLQTITCLKCNSDLRNYFTKNPVITTATVIIILALSYFASTIKKTNPKLYQDRNITTEDPKKILQTTILNKINTYIEKRNLKYRIIHEDQIKGTAYKKQFYVLIDPIDLTSDSFKTDIMAIIGKIAKENDDDMSLYFYDSEESLTYGYNLYGVMNKYQKSKSEDEDYNRLKTKEERLRANKIAERHNIASYHNLGDKAELSGYKEPVVISFFPSAFKDSPKVGKYVGEITCFKIEECINIANKDLLESSSN
jgi:hypothetical protein